MNTTIKFYNNDLFTDIQSGFYTKGSYAIHVEQTGNPGMCLHIYPYSIRKVEDSTEPPIKSYGYHYQKEIINDLEKWKTGRLLSLVAIAKATSQDLPRLQATIDNGMTIPPELKELLNCITFWNNEGESILLNNIYGHYGDEQTQRQARNMEFKDWQLNNIYIDCKTFVKPCADRFQTGKGGNHVWIAEGNDRIFMIHF